MSNRQGLRLTHKKRLHQLVKRISTLDMRAMSAASKPLQAALGRAFGLLCLSNRNHGIGISPDDQYRDVQSYQGVAQVDALLSISESSIGGCDQRFVRAGLRALLVELIYECLLDQARLGKKVCEFAAQVLTAWLEMHHGEHCAIDFWSQTGAVDPDQPPSALRIASRRSNLP